MSGPTQFAGPCSGAGRRTSSAWRRLLLLGFIGLTSVWAAAQTAGESPSAPATRHGADAQLDRFDLDLQTGAEWHDFLLRHLALQRFRTLHDLDAAELNRLLARAPDNIRDLLGTRGHFSPVIDIRWTATAADAVGQPPLGRVTLHVDPGPLTRVATAVVLFRGDIATAPAAAAQREAIRRSGTMAIGAAFSQAEWERSKAAALHQLIAQRYPAGRIYNSLADIDAVTQSAHLYIELYSAAPVRMGAVRVEGSERYDPLVVERLVHLAGLRPGSDYSLEKLQRAQQRVAESGFFESVFVSVDLPQDSPVEPIQVPVRVQVRETQRQKLVLGVGVNTDRGAHLSIEHTHHRVPGIGWRALQKLQIERYDQRLSSDWSAPVNRRGWRWIVETEAARQIDDFTTTTSQRLRAGQSEEGTDLERSFFLQLDRARAVNRLRHSPEMADAELALTANYAWTRQRFDHLPLPERGHGLGVEIGVGSTLAATRQPFLRTQVRWLGLWPLARVALGPHSRAAVADHPLSESDNRAGRLALRLQGGALWAAADAPVPKTQLFLAGGDSSVRGYGLRDIGVAQIDGSVAPGRYLALASLEWQRPVWRHGLRTPWESVLFVDAGAVADEPNALRPQWGLGAGLRYNSLVGPLQVDLAYGVTTQRLRLHLNVGFTF